MATKKRPLRDGADDPNAKTQWARKWLDAVADGTHTMSQRSLESIEKKGGGLSVVKKMAQQRSLHLLRLDDDRGVQLIAASSKPFKIIC